MISDAMTPLPHRALPYDDGGLGLPYPSKIIAVHLNFASPSRRARPDAGTAVLLPQAAQPRWPRPAETVERPAGTELLGFEGEIALVIGERPDGSRRSDGWSRVAGVTAANDLGVYDLRYADKGSNLRSKGGDGFTPIGPRLIPAAGIEPAGLRLRTWVNGELVQQDDDRRTCSSTSPGWSPTCPS